MLLDGLPGHGQLTRQVGGARLAELAEAGPGEIDLARTYLREAYLPLASAAWPWKSAFGDTDLSVEQMQNFVSTETFAIRHYAGSHPHRAPAERIGFAYAPNPAAAGRPDFVPGNGLILDRLASLPWLTNVTLVSSANGSTTGTTLSRGDTFTVTAGFIPIGGAQ